MNKSATLITTALLTLGFAGASMAANTPKSAAPMAADSTAPAAAKSTSHKHSSKKHKKASTAPATTK
jgi:hypothetical protein